MTREELNAIIEELYQESKKAYEDKEIPVSACVLLSDGTRFISHNKVEEENNPFSHAEYNAINNALKTSKDRYLKDAILIVTLEPCLFCMGAILKAGIKDIYYIVDDPKLGSLSHYHAFVDDTLRVHRIEDKRFETLLTDFFSQMRNKNN